MSLFLMRNIQLFAHFSLSPTPQVEWFKLGHRLPGKAKVENHGKLLIVSRVEQEDGGRYMCKAKNTLGEAVHYFTVTVEGDYSQKRPQNCVVTSSIVHLFNSFI